MSKKRTCCVPSGLRLAAESIILNRIEQKQGEIEELQELQRDLERSERLEDSKVWGVLDKLWGGK